MKIVQKYLILESLKTFTFGIIIFVVILIFSKLQELLEFIINKGISPLIVAKLLLYLLPALLAIAIPMAFILGVILGLGRLSEQKEIIALKTCGVHKYQIIKPVFIFSVILVVFLFLFNSFLMPYTNKMYVKTVFNAMTEKVQLIINEREYSDISNDVMIYTESYDRKKNELNNVNLKIREKDGTLFLFAKSGKFLKFEDELIYQFIMHDGSLSKMTTDKKLINGVFDRMEINIDLSQSSDKGTISDYGTRSMNVNELLDSAKRSNDDVQYRKIMTEYHKRFSIPLCILSLFGVSFFVSLKLKVGSKAMGIFVSVSIIFAYYLLMLIGFDLANKGTLTPLIGTNLPNIVFLVPSVIGIKKI